MYAVFDALVALSWWMLTVSIVASCTNARASCGCNRQTPSRPIGKSTLLNVWLPMKWTILASTIGRSGLSRGRQFQTLSTSLFCYLLESGRVADMVRTSPWPLRK